MNRRSFVDKSCYALMYHRSILILLVNNICIELLNDIKPVPQLAVPLMHSAFSSNAVILGEFSIIIIVLVNTIVTNSSLN